MAARDSMQTVFLHGFATNPKIWNSPLSGRAPAIGFEDLEAESCRIAETLGPKTVLVGWSMGGMAALRIADLAPEKVCALVLVSTTPKFLKSRDFPQGLPPALLKKLEKKIRSQGISAFHDLVFGGREVSGKAEISRGKAQKELAELARVDLRPILPRIKTPTLIIHGDQDEICLPGAAFYMRDRISGSELVMLEGVGHAPMIEVPEIFNSLIKKHAG